MGENEESDEEVMRYGMLGEDPANESEKLEKYTGTVDWQYLKPHFENGALLYIDPSLSLVEVGEAFTRDDTEAVANWRGSGDIVVPSELHAEYWEKSEATFFALVVSPFVLAQPVED